MHNKYGFILNKLQIKPYFFVLLEKKYCKKQTYTGENLILAEENENGFYFTEDTVKKTNAGTYKVTAKLTTDYQWTDGTTEDKTINCTIEKASPSIETTPKGTTNQQVGTTMKVGITSNTNGTITLKSSNKDYFTASLIDNNPNITPNTLQEKILITFLSSKKAEGHITITLTPEDTKNYYSASTTFTIGDLTKHQLEIPTPEKYCSNKIYNNTLQNIINNNIPNLTPSEPYSLIKFNVSGEFPNDLDILRPILSLIIPVK